ncbi:GP46-like surface antigen, putative [Bodo saltans]|uniref:GP46-like surface antigen, putative n=1 Tax=Bodo saltans TaxID=75058 RepID=A0A0S4KIT5_BODSA|nr:GP46-like surface antigen, putative [Bodo saltans]|eukprot:CUI15070.1 GP46-like surface antigen, putative [Bodo saltans]
MYPFVIIILLVALCVVEKTNAVACFCDTDLTTNAALLNIRTAAGIAGWNVSLSTCTWTGVGCSATALTTLSLCYTGVACTGGSLPSTSSTWQTIGVALTSLVISGAAITGAFPSAASTSLTKLTTLSFSSYSPTGTMLLPASTVAYSMTLVSSSSITIASSASARLTYLAVTSSTVPDVSGISNLASISINSGTLGTMSWTSMTGLTSVTISYNTGALPSWTGANYPVLQSIALSYQTGAASLPTSWGSIQSLTSMSISYCSGITSTLPASWSSLTMLRTLSVYSTPITGPLPTTWNSLASITSIGVISASFAGATLPSAWTSIPKLTSLTISSSDLGGPLPQWPTSTLLTYLGLQSNSITSPLPTVVNGWSTLTTLDISNNPIGGTLPPWAAMTSLLTFVGSSSSIIGPLPQWGSASSPMGSLQTISISNNVFGGTIPASWAQMPALVSLFAFSSSLIGQLPFTWSSAVLNTLSLSGNSLSGGISLLTFASTTFSALDLSSNRIGSDCTLTVPASLKYLALNDNLCSGTHPNWSSGTSLTFVALGNNSFNGTLANIPSTVLQTLRVDRGNKFTGTLPKLSTSSSLSEISASNNWFTGTLPPFSSSAKPRKLLFAANNLSGTLPYSATVLSMIQYLDISANYFTGAPPSLSTATSLIQLNISSNNFTGSLVLRASLSSLTLLDVSCNSLSGALPSWSSCSNLAYVNLSCGNAFRGTMPILSSSAYDSLTVLDASDQGLTGVLSSILPLTYFGSRFPLTAATSVLLGGNSFTGTIPQFLQWQKLERFNVSGNSLAGTLAFTTTGNPLTSSTFPPNLWSIDISNNALSGTIPVPSAVVLAQVRQFLLGGDVHNFGGTLPTLNTIFPNLTQFSLSGTFPVVIPYTWLVGSAAWVNLTTLSLRKCGFSGTFPHPLASTSLTLLDLSWNRLSGTLPTDLPSFAPQLVTLNVDMNGFSSSLPASWSSLTRLLQLDAHSCLLSGSIPVLPLGLQVVLLWNNSLASSSSQLNWSSYLSLQQLDISSNRLTAVPLFTNTSQLVMLNISDNEISAGLPASWGTFLPSIVALNVSRNSFFGGIPLAWATTGLPFLASLDASSNTLSNLDNSSVSMALLLTLAFPQLQLLWLQGNNYSGTLSTALQDTLSDVDISRNRLTGEVPSELISLAVNLTSLNLCGNLLVGSLPKLWGVTATATLSLLNISSNKLSGALPYNWNTLFKRTTVDLCNNHICGPAPRTLSSIANIGFSRCPGTLVSSDGCYTSSVEPSVSNTKYTPRYRTRSAVHSNSTTQSQETTWTKSLSRTPSMSASASTEQSVSETRVSPNRTVTIMASKSPSQSSTSTHALTKETQSSSYVESPSPSTSVSDVTFSLDVSKSVSPTRNHNTSTISFTPTRSSTMSSKRTTTVSAHVTLSFSKNTKSSSKTPTLSNSTTPTLHTNTLVASTTPTWSHRTPSWSRTPTRVKTPTPTTSTTPSLTLSWSPTQNVSTATLSGSVILVEASVDAFAAAVNDLTATASALTSILSAADISNVNTLMLMSYVDCRGTKSIDSMRDGTFSSYMISPFMDVGWAAVAWGNLALGALALLLNVVVAAVVTVIKDARKSTLVRNDAELTPPPTTFGQALHATVFGDVRVSAAFPPFPAIGLRIVELWTSGSVLGAFAELTAASNASSGTELARYVTGVLVMLSCVSVLVGWQMTLIHKVLPHTTFVEYQLDVLCDHPLAVPRWAPPRWLLPMGSWRPPPVRRRFKQLFVAQVSTWSAKSRIFQNFGLACLSSLLTASTFVNTTSCEVSCALLAVVFFSSALFNARFVLYRCPFDAPLAVSTFALLGVQCSFLAAKEASPTWISLIQTILTIVRAALRLIAGVLEKNMEAHTEFEDDDHNKGNAMAGILFDYYDDDDAGGLPLPEENGEDELEYDPDRVFNPIDMVAASEAAISVDHGGSATGNHHFSVRAASSVLSLGGLRPSRRRGKTDLEIQFKKENSNDDDDNGLDVENLNDFHHDEEDDDSDAPPPPPTPPLSSEDEADTTVDGERIHNSMLERAAEAEHNDEQADC